MKISLCTILTRPVLALAMTVSVAIASAEGSKRSVPNAAASFAGGAAEGRTVTLSSLKGKPVLLLIAPSPKDPSFRTQVLDLRGCFERLVSHGTICFAAFTRESGVIPSNIPFLTVNDPAAVASSYDVVSGFAVAVIGVDGNLDCISTKPLPGQRIIDIINNNASLQEKLRR